MSDSFIFPDAPDGGGPDAYEAAFGAPPPSGEAATGPSPFAPPAAPAAPAAPVAAAPASIEFAPPAASPTAPPAATPPDAPAPPDFGNSAFVAGGPAASDVTFSETPADPAAEPPPAEPDETKKGGKTPRVKRSGRTKDALVLGVHVTQKNVYGVLVRPTADGYEPLRQFVRNRAESQFGGDAPLSPDLDDAATSGDEPSFELGDDVEGVQFGGVGEIDFSAEFAGMGVATDASLDTSSTVGEVQGQAQPIIFELRDILDECADAGFARPALAFAVDAPDVAYVEVTVPPDTKASKKKKKGKKKKASDAAVQEEATTKPPTLSVKRDRLLELLAETAPDLDPPDPSRVAFVPMTPRDGLERALAVVPLSTEPVAESLRMLREQSRHRRTAFKTIEAEVPLLVGLVAATSNPEPHENTTVVRVGAEDTIVLLMSGGVLDHYEHMPSVTAFDGPDTICSRVLLQQDVQGVGQVDNVIIVAEEREKELVQGFGAFYPEARVETLRAGLARFGLVGPYGPLAPMLVEAAGAAVAGDRLKDRRLPFADGNLLPDALRKRKRRVDLSFGWHTLVAAAALFLSVLYFSYLYVSQEGEIERAEQTLAEFPPEAQLSAPQLQARIDSLRARQQTLTAALVALDSVLVDTDRWTQTLLRATRGAAQTGGIWIEEWTPSDADVALRGYATSRANVVGLAQRLSADIEEVTFQEVRDYPVYEYRLRFTQPAELPQVTRVLRERAGASAPDADPLSALDAPPPGDAPDTQP